MELTALTELFSSVGLPIGLVAILIFIIYKMGQKQNEEAKSNMEKLEIKCQNREDALMEEIKENRRVNEKAIDTIAHYSEKLDNIQSDIKEIKQDVTLIMVNGGTHYDRESC